MLAHRFGDACITKRQPEYHHFSQMATGHLLRPGIFHFLPLCLTASNIVGQTSLTQVLGRLALQNLGELKVEFPDILLNVLQHTTYLPEFKINLLAVAIPPILVQPQEGQGPVTGLWWTWPQGHEPGMPEWWRHPLSHHVRFFGLFSSLTLTFLPSTIASCRCRHWRSRVP